MKHVLIFCAILFLACNKSANKIVAGSDVATIIYTGDVSYDGCGWLIKINDSTLYHPSNLQESYKQDNLKVKVEYIKTGNGFSCGLRPFAYKEVNITSIIVL